ncbi:hypothetical protein UFOVP239_31 [uncultured Caudovirales phage]|uniref:Uncharacterized protein n=1 Tax=uncultured Caudovirales phage TaxID=2100421 RepID=A0A6J7WT88_9CAUD|nr:hypothetical protein UFOVP239_31 [uncultured Caudovirales phage]
MTPMVRYAVELLAGGPIDPVEMSFFDMSAGDFGKTEAQPQYLSTHRPPFEKNVIVWRGKTTHHDLYEAIMIVIGQDPEEGIVCTVWKGPSGAKLRPVPSMLYVSIDGQVKYGAADDAQPIVAEEAGLVLGMVASWYKALDQKVEASRPTWKPTFTNRRKIAQGKIPAYDWVTVTVEPAKSKSEHQGGTHASPRLHDRRGHMRRLSNGKTVWVKPCKVGDVTKGIVFHDYEIQGS